MAGEKDVISLMWSILSILSIISLSYGESLFTNPSDLTILSSENINKSLHGSEVFWFVNFYNSWCGHCINFAPTWTELGQDVKAWGAVIRIAALDCSVETNKATCRDYDITSYPELRFFNPKSVGHGIDSDDSSPRTVESLRHNMINHLMTNGSHFPIVHPLLPLTSIDDLSFEIIHGSSKINHRVIIVEDEKSQIGAETILDMWSCDNLLLRRMDINNAKKYGAHKYPAIYTVNKDDELILLRSRGSTREDFVATLKYHIQHNGELSPKTDTEEEYVGAGDSEDVEKQDITEIKDGVFMTDLLSAIRYSLHHEIGSRKSIEGDSYKALRDYMHVLTEYFPGPASTMKYLQRVNDWIKNMNPPISGSAWTAILVELQDSEAYLPTEDKYVGCRGSETRFRGYPCSMWMLFHTLTVNAVHCTQLSNFTTDPKVVLLAMRGYITQFFGCRECSENFNKGAKYIEERVQTPDDSILFLWKSHNKANLRLHGDMSEDPLHPKLQFPPQKLCSKCYINASVSDQGIPNWNTEQVLLMLKNFYSKENIQYDSSINMKPDTERLFDPNQSEAKRKQIMGKVAEIRDNKLKNKLDIFNDKNVNYDVEKIERLKKAEQDTRIGPLRTSGFNGIDLSLCVIFYLLCTGLIIVIYFHFTIRRKMKVTFCCNDMV